MFGEQSYYNKGWTIKSVHWTDWKLRLGHSSSGFLWSLTRPNLDLVPSEPYIFPSLISATSSYGISLNSQTFHWTVESILLLG